MRAATVVASLALLAACSAALEPASPPLEAEARHFVAEAVRLAQAGDFVGLCAMGGGNCERILETAGRDNVPLDAPTIVGVHTVPNQHHADGSWSAGGQLVELCGTDRHGDKYETQMIVFRDKGDRLIAIEPIYWSGIGIITSGPGAVVPGPPRPFAC